MFHREESEVKIKEGDLSGLLDSTVYKNEAILAKTHIRETGYSALGR